MMLAPANILTTWSKFDDFPMDTLTKVWFYDKVIDKRQRDVALMKEHRNKYGVSGNCFDLAIWLLDELGKNGIDAYPIGHDLFTADAHVAIVALDENGHRFLCDLGDQWLRPILIDSNNDVFTDEKLSGFFPAAQVQVKPLGNRVEVIYYRSNGKTSRQFYDTEPIDETHFLMAAEYSQNLIKPRPLLECRVFHNNQLAHWEFCDWQSFLSTKDGLLYEKPLNTVEEWSEKINMITGYDKQFLFEALEIYKGLSELNSR
ncbi:hypothetical protein ACSVDA_15280 [Cytobacillus sp. Hm23]